MRFKSFITSLTFLLLALGAAAQTFVVDGTVIDATDNTGLFGASVKLMNVPDSTIWQGAIADADGKFSFDGVKNGSYRLQISYIGYRTTEKPLTVNGADVHLNNIVVKKQSTRLKEVEIVAEQKHVEQKADTTEYNANAYKVNKDASAEDLVTKMPGISSDNGTVKAHGETVQKVYVDGKEFFGDDATLALKNLPAEVIDKVQVFDKQTDQAQFTGFDDGNSQKAINILTKSGKSNGIFGKVYAGDGYITDDKYSAGGIFNYFNGERRISVLAMSNNVNQQNFSTQDLLGVTGASSQRGGGGGRRGGGGNGGSATNNFLIGNSAGISTTHSAGFNYTDMWGKKVKVTGSYFFNYTGNSNTGNLNRQYFNAGDSSTYYAENNYNKSTNLNHRINLRLEYQIDSNNKIIFSPRVGFQSNRQENGIDGTSTLSETEFLSHTNSQYVANSSGFNFSGDVMYQHKFKKPHRTFSMDISGSGNGKQSTTTQNSWSRYAAFDDTTFLDQQTTAPSSSYNTSANITYTEPAGKMGMVQFTYNPGFTWSKSDKETDNIDSNYQYYSQLDTQLSSKYDNFYMTQKGGVGYRLAGKQFNLSFGTGAQYAQLKGQEVFPYNYIINRTFFNMLPQAMFSYRFKNKSNLRIFYRTSTTPPSINQLQSVINNSNPLLLSTGNPNLKQSYTHSFMLRYGLANSKKGHSFFAFLSATYTQNYIGNNTLIAMRDTVLAGDVILHAGSQLTSPININGSYAVNSFFTYGLPITKIKCNFNLNAGFTFNSTPGLINNLRNVANTYGVSGGFGLTSNISDKIDFSINFNPSYNIVDNSLQKASNNNYYSHTAGVKFNWQFWKGFVANTSLNNTLYAGVSQGFNQNVFLWNASLAYKFLKNESLEVKASVSDILNQNTGIARTVTDTYVEDSRTQVLKRYWLLTVTYTFRYFKAGKAPAPSAP